MKISKSKRGKFHFTEKNNEKTNIDSVDFSGHFNEDAENIRQKMSHNSDVHFREFYIGGSGIQAMMIFVEGLSDQDLINKHILKALMSDFSEAPLLERGNVSLDFIKMKVLPVCDVKEVSNKDEMMSKVLTGRSALLVAGWPIVLLLGTVNEKKRAIDEPISEASVRGPRIGFTESLGDNTAILRSLGENNQLILTKYQVGKTSKKDLVVAYIQSIANQEIVDEVINRIQKINIDYVLESGYIEQLIEDNYLSPFPQLQNTERPDRVMGALMEGRVAILLDGTPFALIVPVTFSMLLQSPEDYYDRWIPSTLIRLLRTFAALISIFGPALYIAFIEFHPGLIPTKLVISIAGTREGVPFPAYIEALMMEFAIEILREAGLRLPKPIGPAIGIVGGLVIGEAAVQAGIVSPIMVIVVAITAISSFAVPQYSAGISMRILRFAAMLCATVFGLYGIILFTLLLGSHLVRLKSFGVPYASPAVPYHINDWKDFILRVPIFMMKKRPQLLQTKNPTRKG